MKRIERLLYKHWWLGLIALLTGAVIMFVVNAYAPTKLQPPPQETPARVTSGWGIPLLVVAVALVVGGIVHLLQMSELRRLRRPDSRRRMINELTHSLQKALSAIDLIRHEIDEGNELIRSLEEEKEIKSRLAKLSNDDAAAVVSQMKDAARQAAGRSNIVQAIVNFVFFAAGAVVSLLIAQRF